MGIKEKINRKRMERNVGRAVGKMSLTQQVELVSKLPIPMAIKRKGLLNDLPTDIKRYAGQGMSQSQIKDYYWNCESFKKMWLNFELDEVALDELIRKALEA